jgi:predicted nucleic acid-binding protein
VRDRIYVDTSVIGGCEDEEFSDSSRRLLARFVAGEAVLVLSDLTLEELADAPESVRRVLDGVSEEHVELATLSEEATTLAASYINAGAIGPGSWADALHIALATTTHVTVLVSWNFRHIVNLSRIRAYNAVNLREGYDLLEIRSPPEVAPDD